MAFNVLIVDDSSSMRAVIKKIIKVFGFDVGEFLEAADGLAALNVLGDSWVDLVLTDINMPKMDGLKLIKETKKDQILSSVPVVVVSTEGSEKRVQESMEIGASGYIKKPFMPEDVIKTLSGIMGEGRDESRDW